MFKIGNFGGWFFLMRNVIFFTRKENVTIVSTSSRKKMHVETPNIRSSHCSLPVLPRGSPKDFHLPQSSQNQESFTMVVRDHHKNDIYEKNTTEYLAEPFSKAWSCNLESATKWLLIYSKNYDQLPERLGLVIFAPSFFCASTVSTEKMALPWVVTLSKHMY